MGNAGLISSTVFAAASPEEEQVETPLTILKESTGGGAKGI